MSTQPEDSQRDQPNQDAGPKEKSYSMLRGFTITEDAMRTLWHTQRGGEPSQRWDDLSEQSKSDKAQQVFSFMENEFMNSFRFDPD